jgi:acetylornithine deacetylase
MYSEVVQLAQQMVAIPSVNPQDTGNIESPYGEARMADFVCDWLGRYNLNCCRQEVLPGRENVLSLAEGTDRSKTLLLSAHMDTVDVEGMSIEPFEPVVREGRLYGRGSCDTKGPLAAMMLAFRDRVLGGQLPCNLLLLATCGEEFNLLGSGHYAKQAGSDLVAAVFAEPTELSVVVAHKAVVRLKLTCHGRSAHSSTPHLGDNAIYTMTRAIDAVKHYGQTLAAAKPDPLLGTDTLAVTVIEGGRQINVIPNKCQARIDWRMLPSRRPEQCRDELAAVLAEELGRDKFSLELLSVYNSMQTDVSEPLVEALLSAAQKTVHRRTTAAAPYATDASSFADPGLPTCVFGPGNPHKAHTKDEYIEIEQLETGRLAYEVFLNGRWPV